MLFINGFLSVAYLEFWKLLQNINLYPFLGFTVKTETNQSLISSYVLNSTF